MTLATFRDRILTLSFSPRGLRLMANLTTDYCAPEDTNPQLIADVATIFIALCGAVHNVLLLIIAYRLDWFSSPTDQLSCNKIVAHLLTCIWWTIVASANLIYNSLYCGSLPSVTSSTCFLISSPARILITVSTKCALVTSIDRLIRIIKTYKWMNFGGRYRGCLIGLTWFWGILHGIWAIACLDWRPSTDFNGDCFSIWQDSVRGPRTYFWISWIIDTILVVGLRIAIIVCAVRVAKRALPAQYRYYRAVRSPFHQRLRRICIVSVSILIANLFVLLGQFLVDIRFVTWLMPVALTFAVWPLYICVWEDKDARRELKRLFSVSVFRGN